MFILIGIILQNNDCTYLHMICMSRLKINNGLYWTKKYIHWNNVMFITYILMY